MAHEDLALLTVAELAAICRTGEDWIRASVAARKIPFCMPTREIKFTREQAERIIASFAFEPEQIEVPTVQELANMRADAVKASRKTRMTGPNTPPPPPPPRKGLMSGAAA